MDKFFNKHKQQVLDYFEVNYNGLNTKQVEINRKKYGHNMLVEKESKSKARVFLEQFQDLLVIILIISAFISLFTGELESTIVIFIVISLNAILGTYQFFKAEKSLESLKQIASPIARVIRNGIEIEVMSEDVVVGDIVLVKAGDIICADGRIISYKSFEVNESSLTGESHNIEKHDEIINKDSLVIGDQKNMVFSGSLVTQGKASFVVTRVGMETELGKIAQLLDNTKSHKTPLQISLDDFSKKLAIGIIIICLVVFGLSLYRHITLINSLMFAVALAVAAIPEALSSIVTIVLAIGTQRMAEENAIIKELKAVEGLGCVSVICSDKTGTLTQNKMEINKVYIDNKLITIDKMNQDLFIHRYFTMCCFLNNDSILSSRENANATEFALVEFVKKIGINLHREIPKYPRVSEILFDSNRKMMSTLNKIDQKFILFSKGASDRIIPLCSQIYSNLKVRRITEGDRYDINIVIKNLTSQGYRILAIAYKEIPFQKKIDQSDEKDLIFIGFVGIIDPPRLEAKKAIKEAFKAKIKPVMITGDHPFTAIAIGKEVGLYNNNDLCLTGVEIDRLTDQELIEKLKFTTIFARVSPEHKIRIVKAWQDHGDIVAFVGDGINDAPALRQSNIGISMGMSGTEVSKDASSIILTDDNYYTIIKAVKNGRKIYSNIQNAIRFLLSGNLAGILLVIYTSILFMPIPFAPVHLLFINLLTDSLPAIAIGMEERDEDMLNSPPRKIKESLLNNREVKIISLQGILIALFTILAYYTGLKTNQYVARTCVFGTLCMARLFHSFNCRGTKIIFKNTFKNKAMVFSFIIGMFLINFVLFFKPMNPIFHTYPLITTQIILMYIYAVAPTIILQIMLLIRQIKRAKTIVKQ